MNTTRGGDEFGFDHVDLAVLRARRTLKWSGVPTDVLAAWVAEMDFPTAPVVRDAVADAVQREQFGYPVDDEVSGLPEAVADWMAHRHGWKIAPNQVHSLPSVIRGVEIAVEFFTATDSAVVVPTPAYGPFFRAPQRVRRNVIEVPCIEDDGHYTLDLEGIGAAFAGGAGSIALCHPYNPVGRCFAPDELEALAQVVDHHGARVISDEIHAPLVFPDRVHVPYASLSPVTAAHTVTLTAASKAWNLPGLKCAVAITTNPEDERRWADLLGYAHGASTLGIVGSIAAFTEGEPWLDAALAYLDETRTWLPGPLAEHLPGVRYTPPEATYLAWLDFRALDLPEEPADHLLEHGKVQIIQGNKFGADGEGFLRLNLATSRSMLEQVLAAIAAGLR